MKKILLLIIISFYLHSINAQNENKDYNVKILFLNEYPYTNVLDYLHNPDTLVFFNYKPRRYQEKKAPFAINLFIYRKNNEWWSTSLLSYTSGKRGYYWELLEPMWIHTEISKEINGMVAELDSLYYSYDISTIHTWVYVNCGKIITKDLIGNIPDIIDIAPMMSRVFMIGFLESYNNTIVKTYRRKNATYP